MIYFCYNTSSNFIIKYEPILLTNKTGLLYMGSLNINNNDKKVSLASGIRHHQFIMKEKIIKIKKKLFPVLTKL